MDEEWAERDDPELRKAFREKVERCWNWFCDDIQDCTPLELLNRARKLEAARTSYILLKKPALPLECIQYLIRFANTINMKWITKEPPTLFFNGILTNSQLSCAFIKVPLQPYSLYWGYAAIFYGFTACQAQFTNCQAKSGILSLLRGGERNK